MLDTILLIGALLCFIAVALDVNAPRVNLLGVGLALWVLTALT